jgi:SAM-dependent methyltransferase
MWATDGAQGDTQIKTCKTRAMGRFASTVEFYARYREPYSPEFFASVARQIGLHGTETLLDVGCGPGLLAIGFAPYVGRCSGIDPEAGMIAAAKSAAEKAGVALTLTHGRIEEFSAEHPSAERPFAERPFDVVTIGRALHWMDRTVALPVLERIVSGAGCILICRASSVETPETPWLKAYDELRRRWASGIDGERYQVKEWFAGSAFGETATVSVTERREITIADLVGRSLSRSITSPAVLGERRAAFEAEIRTTLEPFAKNGVLQEQIVARATIFTRTAH